MKYLYTTKPDKHCHEVAPGIYGRPTHTTEQPKLRKLGWADSIHKLKEADHGLRKDEEEGRKEEGEVAPKNTLQAVGEYFSKSEEEHMAALYEEVIGKKPHHKMKFETIKAKVDEALKDD